LEFITVGEKNNLEVGVGGGQTKFARIIFHLPKYGRFIWQISRYKLIKLGH